MGRPRKYQWDVWQGRPFQQFTVRQGFDFEDTKAFSNLLHVRAVRTGMKVAVEARDFQGLGRLSFRFFGYNDPRPELLPHGTTDDMIAELAAEAAFPEVTCALCGEKQIRMLPTLVHIEECLVRSGNPSDTNWYAKHRYDQHSETTMRKVPIVGTKWSYDKGPH